MRRVVNIYAGPGAGKSTLATGLFSSLKFDARNVEYVSEYAKDITWEERGPSVFKSQEYIFAQQYHRMERLVGKVDFMITDSPILLGLAYVPSDYSLKSLENLVYEADSQYESISFFLKRSKKYIQAGRSQTFLEAEKLDEKIREILHKRCKSYIEIDFSRDSIAEMREFIHFRGW